MGIKQTLKYLIPAPLRSRVKNILGVRFFLSDVRGFYANFSDVGRRGASQAQLEARLNFYSHAIEKGLSHSSIRFGFGKDALRHLESAMSSYIDLKFPEESESFQNAVSVLGAYINLHEEAGIDLSYIESYFSAELIKAALDNSSSLGGVMTLSSVTQDPVDSTSFERLMDSRKSVREFSSQSVCSDDIERAIRIASKTPSVCNRQAWRVRFTQGAELESAILRLQGGFSGYPTPPALIAVSADLNSLLGVHERNQCYIDDGLFSMSLLLALQSLGLGSCALNAMQPPTTQRRIKRLLGLPDNEVLIMFIAVGHPLQDVKIPRSFRYPAEKILHLVDRPK